MPRGCAGFAVSGSHGLELRLPDGRILSQPPAVDLAEIRVVVAPSIAGTKRRLFDNVPRLRLELLRSETSPGGYLLADYRTQSLTPS